eukprot:EG_transcript_2429
MADAAPGQDPAPDLGVDLMPVRYLSSLPVADRPGTPASPTGGASPVSIPDSPTTAKLALHNLHKVNSMAPSRKMPIPAPSVASDVEQLLHRMAHPTTETDQENATAALCNLLADFYSHDVVVRLGGLPVLFGLLRDPDLPHDTHYGAACALHNLSCQAELLGDIVQAGGIEVLLGLLRNLPPHHHESLQSLVQVVRRLSFQDSPVKLKLVACGAVNAMVGIIQSDVSETTRANAAAAIQSLSFINDRLLDDYPAAVATLIDLLLTSSNKQTQGCLIGALQNFSVHGSKYMGPSIIKFFDLLQTENPTLVKCGALLLHNLAVEPAYKATLLHSGMVPTLVDIVRRTTSPETRLYALGCLHYVAQYEGARARLLEDGAVACALDQLKPTVPALVREHALGLVENVAQCSPLQGAMAAAGCLEAVVAALGAPYATGSEQYLATVALNYLCFHNVPNKLRVVEAGAIPAIMGSLTAPDVADKLTESLLAAVQSISVEESTSGTLLAHGGLPALLGVLRAGGASPTAKEYAAGALQNLVFAQETMEQLFDLGGPDTIAALLLSPATPATAKESVAVVVENVSLEAEFRDRMATRDVILGLLAVLRNHRDARFFSLQEEVLGALQNLSMSASARAQLAALGAVETLAATVGEAVPLAVKERAVFTLYHLCVDTPESLRVLAKTAAVPAIDIFATRYPHRPELRQQLLQFVADLKAPPAEPPVDPLDRAWSGPPVSPVVKSVPSPFDGPSATQGDAGQATAEVAPAPPAAADRGLAGLDPPLLSPDRARRPSAMFSTEVVSPNRTPAASKRDARQKQQDAEAEGTDGTAVRLELVQAIGDGGLEAAPLSPSMKSIQKVHFRKPIHSGGSSGSFTKAGSPRGKSKAAATEGHARRDGAENAPPTSLASSSSQPSSPTAAGSRA